MLLCRLKVDLPPTHSVRGWRLFSDPFFSKLGQTDTCTQWGKSSPVGLRLGAHRDGGSWLLLPQQQAAGLQKHSLPRGRQRSLRWRCGEDWWGLGYLRKARCCCTPDSEGLQTVERNSCQKKHFSFLGVFFFFMFGAITKGNTVMRGDPTAVLPIFVCDGKFRGLVKV